MASSKVMVSSNSRNSDLSRRPSTSSSSTKPSQSLSNHHQPRTATANFTSTMTVDGILRNVYSSNPSPESTLLDAQITLIDTPIATPTSTLPPTSATTVNITVPAPDAAVPPPPGDVNTSSSSHKTVEDVWREIVSGERKEMKEEAPDEMMTLEDFLARAGAVEEEDVKVPRAERLSGGVFAFDPIPPSPFQQLDKVEGAIVAFGNGVEVMAGAAGRGKRGRAALLEPLDKAAQQRQRRMIKNRESAARSRERKQAHQVELESMAVRLEEENEQLLKEKAERTKERLKQLKEKIVPVVEKRKPARILRRVRSLEW